MRLLAISGLISIVAILTCAGCAGTQGPSSGIAYPAPAGPAPLKLCPAAASIPKDLAEKPGFTILTVTVTDTASQPVTGLKQTNFEPHSNATAYPIAYFHADDGAAPESIALVIDTSGSMLPKLPTVKQTLGGFIGKLNPCDEIAIIAFSDQSFLIQPFTTDHQLATQKLSLLKANGETAMYDSINQAIDIDEKNAHYRDRAIILITDGMDNKSTGTKDDTVTKVKQSGVQMFLVGIGDPNLAPDLESLAIGPFIVGGGGINRVDAKTLNEFASATGGKAYIVSPMTSDDGYGNSTVTNGEFAAAIAKIGSALGHGYSIGVVLPPGVSASSVTVAVPSHPGAVVTTRPAPAAKSPPS